MDYNRPVTPKSLTIEPKAQQNKTKHINTEKQKQHIFSWEHLSTWQKVTGIEKTRLCLCKVGIIKAHTAGKPRDNRSELFGIWGFFGSKFNKYVKIAHF